MQARDSLCHGCSRCVFLNVLKMLTNAFTDTNFHKKKCHSNIQICIDKNNVKVRNPLSALNLYRCCWRSWVCGVKSTLKAHTSPRGWLQPCAGGRWCQAAVPPTDTGCCSEVSPQRRLCCLQQSGRTACTQTAGRGSPWRAAAATSPGCLLSCGW